MKTRPLVTLLCGMLLSSCQLFSWLEKVEQDRRTVYRESQSLPDLEIPPDLTAEASPDQLSVPGAGETLAPASPDSSPPAEAGSGGAGDRSAAIPATAAQPETAGVPAEIRTPAPRAEPSPAAAGFPPEAQGAATTNQPAVSSPAKPPPATVSPRAADTAPVLKKLPGDHAEQGFMARTSPEQLWPLLTRFWQSRGVNLELDDHELGVMKTEWFPSEKEEDRQVRDRYKIFMETAAAVDGLMLVVEMERQRFVSRGNGQGLWLMDGRDLSRERDLVQELTAFLERAGIPISENVQAWGVLPQGYGQRSVLLSQNQLAYLVLPERFDAGWSYIERGLLRGGIKVVEADRKLGWFDVQYPDESGATRRGRISLTAVGRQTEVAVHDERGTWQAGEEAERLLGRLQSFYAQASAEQSNSFSAVSPGRRHSIDTGVPVSLSSRAKQFAR